MSNEKQYSGWKDEHKLIIKRFIEEGKVDPAKENAAQIDPYYELDPSFQKACNIANFRKNFKKYCKEYLLVEQLAGKRKGNFVYIPTQHCFLT